MGESERQIKDVATVLEKSFHKLDRDYIERWVRELGLVSRWESARHLASLG